MRLSTTTTTTSAIALASLASAATTSADPPAVTALEDCHLHELVLYCVPKPAGEEFAVTTATATVQALALPTEYVDCHSHGSEMFCVDPEGEDVAIEGLSGSGSDEHVDRDDDHEHPEEAEMEDENHAEAGGEHCHFHAGVEHCTGASESQKATTCEKVDREYNIPLRIGSIFIVFVTSALAVFLPLLLRRFSKLSSSSIIFTVVKQFGTGVIITTAFIHLLTHAELMFSNDCVGELMFEATTTAVAMAGLFLSFLVEYTGYRFIAYRAQRKVGAAHSHQNEESGGSVASVASAPKEGQPTEPPVFGCHGTTPTEDKLSVLVMEMGIIFHSILIGITLVVAGDSVFTTLLIVIIFHQAFEGLALGTRISSLAPITTLDNSKLFLASLFAAITPIGMAIGIGVRNHFNGSDRATLITLGTLDALSAGILVWVGLVEMMAHDWLYGDLKRASIGRTLAAGCSLVGGMVLMGLLGKWA